MVKDYQGNYADFNSHAHVERDNKALLNNLLALHFNSHAHVERDQNLFTHINNIGHFNSHAHVERDLTFT